MAGSSNITGQESIIFADNASFDGTERNGALNQNGQLWIGSSTLPHIVKSTITAGSNINITNGPGSITISASSGGITGDTTNHAVIVGAGPNTVSSVGPSATSGQILQSGGSSADPSYSTATYPSTASGTGTILRADGTNWAATTATYPNTISANQLIYGSASNVISGLTAPTLAGSYPMFDGTNWFIFNPQKDIFLMDHFICGSSSGNIGWSSIASGSGAGVTVANTTDSDNAHPGVLVLNTGTTSTGSNTLRLEAASNQAQVVLGGGAYTVNFVVKLGALSSAVDSYVIRFGLGCTTAAAQVAGVYLEYTHSVNSGNYQFITADNSVRTTNNTNTAADTNWHIFTFTVNAAGTSCSAFIDNVLMTNGTITTNIPTTNANTSKVSPIMTILKTGGSTGTTNVTWTIDLMSLVGRMT